MRAAQFISFSRRVDSGAPRDTADSAWDKEPKQIGAAEIGQAIIFSGIGTSECAFLVLAARASRSWLRVESPAALPVFRARLFSLPMLLSHSTVRALALKSRLFGWSRNCSPAGDKAGTQAIEHIELS